MPSPLKLNDNVYTFGALKLIVIVSAEVNPVPVGLLKAKVMLFSVLLQPARFPKVQVKALALPAFKKVRTALPSTRPVATWANPQLVNLLLMACMDTLTDRHTLARIRRCEWPGIWIPCYFPEIFA